MNTTRRGAYIFHECKSRGPLASLELGDRVRARVDASARLSTERHHTATHLLHLALRKILGDHVNQAGSLVGPEKLRFDFTHGSKLTPEQIRAIEDFVNERILAATPVSKETLSMEDAKKRGAVMLFGEKYGDRVRVLGAADSLELCGGTHVGNTGNIGGFKITSEASAAAGIRRIEAISGPLVDEALGARERLLEEIGREVESQPSETLERVRQLKLDVKKAKDSKQAETKSDRPGAPPQARPKAPIASADEPKNTTRTAVDRLRERESLLDEIGKELKSPQGAILDRIRQLKTELRQAKESKATVATLDRGGALTGIRAALVPIPDGVGGSVVLAGFPAADLRSLVDELKKDLPNFAVALIVPEESQVSFVVAAHGAPGKRLKAGEVAKAMGAALGGGGGGRPDFAQGQGKNPAGAAAAAKQALSSSPADVGPCAPGPSPKLAEIPRSHSWLVTMPAGSDPTRQVSRNQFIAILAAVALAFAAVSALAVAGAALRRRPDDRFLASRRRRARGAPRLLAPDVRPELGALLPAARLAVDRPPGRRLRRRDAAPRGEPRGLFLGIASVGAIARRLGAGLLGILFVGIWLVAFPGGPAIGAGSSGGSTRSPSDSDSWGWRCSSRATRPRAGGWRRRRGRALRGDPIQESAIAFAPAAPLLAAAIHGRAAIPRALAASLFVGFAWVLRAFALEFTSGGYVGAPRRSPPGSRGCGSNPLGGGRRGCGLPRRRRSSECWRSHSWYCHSWCWFPRGAARRDPPHGRSSRAPAASPLHRSSAWDRGVEPVHARLFPTFYATLGLAWALALDAIPLGSLPGKLGFRAAAAALLLALPAAGAVRSITNYREAAGRLARDFDAIQVARRARPDEPILAFAGAYQGWPDGGAHAFLYNLGLPERFAPPFAPPGPAVWPLRPALPALASEALAIPRDTPWIVVRDAPHAGVRLLDGETPAVIRKGVELPSSLSGATRARWRRGLSIGRSAFRRARPGRSRSPSSSPTLGSHAPIDSAEGSWKRLLLAQVAGARIPSIR